MGHTSSYCSQQGCQDQHPYHTSSGKILRSMRPEISSPLSETRNAIETIFSTNQGLLWDGIPQDAYDAILEEGKRLATQ